jgi:hypothetical protein
MPPHPLCAPPLHWGAPLPFGRRPFPRSFRWDTISIALRPAVQFNPSYLACPPGLGASSTHNLLDNSLFVGPSWVFSGEV